MADDDSNASTVPGGVYRLLMGIALLGSELGLSALATDMAAKLAELRPDLPHARSVLGIGRFQAGDHEGGLRILEEAAAEFPDHQMGKALLAVCMAEMGRSGWQQMFEAVIDDGRDENAVGLACAVLGRDNEAADEALQVFRVGLPANAVWA